MIDNKIGQSNSLFYLNYAANVYKLLRDYRKTDKIYRDGLEAATDKYKSELQKAYDKFGDAVETKYLNLLSPEERACRSSPQVVQNAQSQRERTLKRKVRVPENPVPLADRLFESAKEDDRFLSQYGLRDRQRTPSFTHHHTKVNKGHPCYVDSDERSKFIPKGSQFSSKYYTELEMKNLSNDIVSETEAYFDRDDRPTSWVSLIGSTVVIQSDGKTAPTPMKRSRKSELIFDEAEEIQVFGGKFSERTSRDGKLLSPEEIRANLLKSRKLKGRMPKSIMKVKHDPYL